MGDRMTTAQFDYERQCPICVAILLSKEAAEKHAAWHAELRGVLNALEGRLDDVDQRAAPAWLSKDL